MIAGSMILVLAMLVLLGQGALAARLMYTKNAKTPVLGYSPQALTKILAWLAFGLLTAAWGLLTYAYVVSDFGVRNVFENSHTLKPLFYRITGVWGNHEGSLLLWVWVMGFFYWLAALRLKGLDTLTHQLGLGVQALMTAFFVLFLWSTSNPFWALNPAPPEGMSLNPLLQDPALAAHPPLLYLGYVGVSIVFSYAIAGLLTGKLGKTWAIVMRPWTVLAWLFLTLGIMLGSYWAYYELGWGGWWFWDPVENAALMPWLTATALLHALLVMAKRGLLVRWTVFLAILTFSLSLLGTFLVRSGVLVSVHSFAADPSRGLFILALFALITGGGYALYGARLGHMPTKALPLKSREMAIVMNNMILMLLGFIVALGTLYPLIQQQLGGQILSVGPAYFERMLLFLCLPFFGLLAVVPFLSWGQTRGFLKQSGWPLLVTFLSAALLMLIVAQSITIKLPAVLLLLCVMWFMLATLYHAGKQPMLKAVQLALVLAHVGFGVAVIGMIVSSAWQQEKIITASAGQMLDVFGQPVLFMGARLQPRENFIAEQVVLNVGESLMVPERRYYPVSDMTTTEAAIRSGFLGDFYIIHGGQDAASGQWVLKFYDNPLVGWIWGGTLIMLAGALLGVLARRRA